jgi:S-adenosylmethionine decarboxylase
MNKGKLSTSTYGYQVGFGFHLTVEGYGGNAQHLGDLGLIYSCLDALPADISMHRISNPHIVRYDGGQIPDDWGISGFILIAESHIAIHTFPDKGFCSFDVFSCKSFDIEKVIDVITKTFEFQKVEQFFFERGSSFPRGTLN